MENSNILQVVEPYRTSLSKMMDLGILSDGIVIKLRKKRLSRLLSMVSAYILIPLSIFILCAGYSLGYWKVVATSPFVLIWSIYVFRVLTRVVEINLVKKTVSTIGRWQKSCTFSWDRYLGSETVYSVMNIPEEFHIIFTNGEKNAKSNWLM